MSDDLIPVNLLEAAIREIAKDKTDFEIEVKEGLTITGSQGRDPVVHRDGYSYKLDEVSFEVEAEIMDAIKKHNKVARSLKEAKYLDPSTNPVIRTDPDED